MIARVVVALALAAAVCLGQVRVYGSLKRPSSQPTTITFKNVRTGNEFRATPDSSGEFQAPNLEPGEYSITVQTRGFRTTRSTAQLPPGIVIVRIGDDGKVEVSAPPPPPPPRAVAATASVGSDLRGGGIVEDARQLTWNAWAEERSDQPSHQPVPALTIGREYQLAIHLATLAYRDGAASTRVQEKLARAIEQATSPVRLQVLLLPDPKFFRFAEGQARSQAIEIAPGKVKQALAGPVFPDPLARLRENPNQDFVVNKASFALRPIKVGTGSIGVSIWKDGVPMDEFSVLLCVSPADAPRCSTLDTVVSTLNNGAELVRPSGARRDGPARAAAMHFVELDSTQSVGVFRMSHWDAGRYETWPLENVGTELRRFLDQSFLQNFTNAEAGARLAIGSELYNLLVPEGVAPRALIEKELTTAAQGATPALWVRLLASTDRLPYSVPLAMMAMPIGGTTDFVGRRFRVETPLPVMDYRPVAGCVSEWTLAVPKGEDEAKEDFASALKPIEAWTKECTGPGCLPTMQALRNWIGSGQESAPRALFLLAHHSERGIYYTPSNAMSEQGIGREFLEPSVAVFSACDVASPQAYRVAERMAKKGISAIIAPATRVPAELGGEYFQTLASKLKGAAGDPGQTLSQAHWEAVRELEPKWGALALSYLLIGNGGLRVCAPPAR